MLSCEYNKMFENGFLLVAASESGWLISKNFGTWEIFVQRIHKGGRFVKMLCSKWRNEIT